MVFLRGFIPPLLRLGPIGLGGGAHNDIVVCGPIAMDVHRPGDIGGVGLRTVDRFDVEENRVAGLSFQW